MTKNSQRPKTGTWDYVLLYLALLKRGELVFVYDEARKREWRPTRTASGRKAG